MSERSMRPRLDSAAEWLSAVDLARLLSPPLASEQAASAVARCARRIGLANGTFDTQEAARVLGDMVTEGGLIGTAARLALRRPPFVGSSVEPAPMSARTARTELRSGILRSEIAALLAPALGDAKSQEVIDDTARALAISSAELTSEEASHLLTTLSQVAGIVGVAARLAKTRLASRGVR